MPNFDPDPWSQARKYVKDKPTLSKIGHSGFFHKLRSATNSKGSALSKGTGVLLAAGSKFLSLIPIPVVGDLIGMGTKLVDGKIRERMHQGHLKSSVSLEEDVKFKLKDVSVGELDRYRWKVQQAITDANEAINKYNTERGKANPDSPICDHIFNTCTCIAQLERRVTILWDACEAINFIMTKTEDWLTQCVTGTAGAKSPQSDPPTYESAAQSSIQGMYKQINDQIQEDLDKNKKGIAALNKLIAPNFQGTFIQKLIEHPGRPSVKGSELKKAWTVYTAVGAEQGPTSKPALPGQTFTTDDYKALTTLIHRHEYCKNWCSVKQTTTFEASGNFANYTTEVGRFITSGITITDMLDVAPVTQGLE